MVVPGIWAQSNPLATVTGFVYDENNDPAIGAIITVKNHSTGFTTGVATSTNGSYTIRQVPLGGPYSVGVRYIGYDDQIQEGYTLNQGDVLRVDFNLSTSSTRLKEVVVEHNVLKNKATGVGASTSVTARDLASLPVNSRNFTTLSDLSPLSRGIGLGGQIGTATNYTIDGMTAKSAYSSGASNRGPYSVSMETIREFEVITNSYDVTYGRAGGGTVSAVTKSGTNKLQGSVFAFQRADYLSSPYNSRGQKTDNKYSITQFGGSLGGPIIKDKLHYFIAWDQQYDARPLEIADIKDEADEKRVGIKKETLSKFVDIARNKYGVADSPQIGVFDKKRNSTSVMARFDWQINEKNLFTLRENFNRDFNDKGIKDNHSPINLYEVYGSHLTMDNSLLASLRTQINERASNILKAQYLYQLDHGQSSSQLPAEGMPKAVVEQVENVSSLQIGGHRYLPEKFKNHTFQLVDNYFLDTDLASYTFGVDIMAQHLNSLATNEMNGRFYFRGLKAFEDNTPYRYAREVPAGDPTVVQTLLNSALYAQAAYTLAPGTDITVGLRGKYTHYFSNPKENPTLKKLLNISTANRVNGFLLQPRVQFTWDINDRHVDYLRIGGGVMGGSLNNYSMINNLQFNGMNVYSLDFTENVPPADLMRYRRDPSTAPGMELFDQRGFDKIGTINVNSDDVKVPVSYKYNLSYTHFFTDRLRAGISFYGTHTRNNYMYVDANMVDDPYFRLANEANRGVYVPANTISSKGITDWTKSRKYSELGRVLELISGGKVNTYTLVLDATYRYFRDGELNFSYSLNDSRDNTSYNGNVANSATLGLMVKDDPRDLSSMNFSDNQWRHKVVLYGSLPSIYGFDLGFRFSGIGGTRYSMITGNVNGDFVSTNDLAYVFDWEDPTVPKDIRDGLKGIMDNPEVEDSFKDYLLASKGKIAERNGGVNDFYGTLDLRLTKDFDFGRYGGLQLSVDAFNVINMFDKEAGLSQNLGKQPLYSITGFDPQRQEYKYKVRSNAGIASPSGIPWQIQIGAKYYF